MQETMAGEESKMAKKKATPTEKLTDALHNLVDAACIFRDRYHQTAEQSLPSNKDWPSYLDKAQLILWQWDGEIEETSRPNCLETATSK
jgi:hypothetical protein